MRPEEKPKGAAALTFERAVPTDVKDQQFVSAHEDLAARAEDLAAILGAARPTRDQVRSGLDVAPIFQIRSRSQLHVDELLVEAVRQIVQRRSQPEHVGKGDPAPLIRVGNDLIRFVPLRAVEPMATHICGWRPCAEPVVRKRVRRSDDNPSLRSLWCRVDEAIHRDVHIPGGVKHSAWEGVPLAAGAGAQARPAGPMQPTHGDPRAFAPGDGTAAGDELPPSVRSVAIVSQH